MKRENGLRPKHQSYILTLWKQGQPAVVRGCLEKADGTRRYFASMEQLAVLFCENGWMVRPKQAQSQAIKELNK